MIAEIKLRAERRAGELLGEMGDAKTGPKKEFSNTMLPNSVPALSDLGITRMQSSRWQSIAQIPEQVFEKHLIETRASRGKHKAKRETVLPPPDISQNFLRH